MINSLFKDSHITHHSRFKKSPTPQSGVDKRENSYSAAPEKRVNRISVNKPAEISFSGFFSPEKLAKNKLFKDFLIKADTHPVVFGAGFVLILTSIFRPAAIMMLPGKKNKDDKKYASAHSVASGVIGFVIASIVSTPFASALEKLVKQEKFQAKIQELAGGFYKDKKAFDTARNILNRAPDILMSAPKAVITIALIPPILKYVFGWEKKSKVSDKQIKETAKPPGTVKPVENANTAVSNPKNMKNFMGGHN